MTASLDALEKPLIEVAASFATAKRAVVAGPGFGTDERAATAIRALLVGYEGNVVLDADALTLRRALFRARQIDPHASLGRSRAPPRHHIRRHRSRSLHCRPHARQARE